MSETRIYTAATGSCIAGDKWDRPEKEQDRVVRDFESGVRLVVDETLPEIRSFVPAYRGSEEAFYAVISFDDDEDVSEHEFAMSIKSIFTQIEGWSIRGNTPERDMIETLELSIKKEQELSIMESKLSSSNMVQIGAPDFSTGTVQLLSIRCHFEDDNRPRVYALSLSEHCGWISPDIHIHVSNEYDSVTLL